MYPNGKKMDLLIYYPEAFDPKSRNIIASSFKKSKIIAVTRSEALAFCCNAIDIPFHNSNGILIANKFSNRIKNLLLKNNFAYIEAPMTQFLLGGGGVKCCILEV